MNLNLRFDDVASPHHFDESSLHERVIESIVDPVLTPVNEFISMQCRKGHQRLQPCPTRQTLPRSGFLLAWFLAWTTHLCTSIDAHAQITDSLDAYPPRWNLANSDCNAEIIEHTNQPNGGIGESGCESVLLQCGHGTEAILEYRIEPTRVIDELTALVYVKSSKPGQRVGLRVRFPYVADPQRRQSVSVIVYGSEYRNTGQWQKIGIGAITSQVRLKAISLRSEYGVNANLEDPFVDAVIINCYTGAGRTQLSIDNVAVDGVVAVSSTSSLFADSLSSARLPVTEGISLGSTPGDITSALPPDRITRILQYNGERLDWLRTLGFDAVLIKQPADERILREAMLARIRIFAPPPASPDLSLESLLEPLAGYYLGTSLNESAVESTSLTVERLRKLPTRWRRPILLSPAESWRAYAAMSDSIVHDLPSSLRGLAADEEIAVIADRSNRTSRQLPVTIGIQSDPPAVLIEQLEAISNSIGAPRGVDVPWHAMQLQVARSLQSGPRAILFRSSRSLTSGLPEDQQRSMALSYINRYLEVVGPVVAGSLAAESIPCGGGRYRCSRLQFPGGHLLIVSSYAQHRGLVLAGDGDTITIELPPGDATKLAWRLTHFSAERMDTRTTNKGPQLEIISPDTVETIIVSNDAQMGGRIAGIVKRVAQQAAMDRWQLTRESLDQLTVDWQASTASQIISANRASIDLLNAAERTLREAEPNFRSGDASSAIRMARRADAWQLRSRWNLHAALSPNGQLSSTTSTPPLLSSGGIPIQMLWWPLMSDTGWGNNRMLGGSLDHASMLGPAGWTLGRRREDESAAEIKIEGGRQVEGSGCLIANVASQSSGPLPGGYAGTTVQLRSPAVRFTAGTPVRIDAKIRTLGFGGPDQGVLIYDTIAGPELGVLVRAMPSWQSVRIYRQCITDGEVQALFELIGAGEVMLDDVQIRAWEPSNPMPNR